MIAALVLSATLSAAPAPQGQNPRQPPAAPAVQATADSKPAPEKAAKADAVDEKPVVAHHEIKVGGRLLKYTTTTGMMPIRNAAGETEAHIFYMAYTLDGAGRAAERPLLFSFNGGPGSSSVWLHLGAIGPKRVKMEPEGWYPKPPFQLVDNESTWLDLADLVFIDPVGTGYSRAAKPELGKKFWSLMGDAQSVGEFVRMYLTRNERWTSPLFVVGESYGTTRAAALSGYLVGQGVAFNGVILISSILNFQTAEFAEGNDTPFPLYLPGYAATAWYHKKLPPDLQQQPLRAVLDQAEKFAGNEYTIALQKGDAMTPAEREAAVAGVARFTGLERRVVDEADLRITLTTFRRELLRDRKLIVGRLDGRFTGPAGSGENGEGDDPSMFAIRPPYTAMFADYVRGELGYKSDDTYYILGGGVHGWDLNKPSREPGESPIGYPNVVEDLRAGMTRNPHEKVFVGMGFYDFATPYFAALHTIDHLGVPPALRKNVQTAYYEAGHMMYIDDASRAKLKKDVAAFFASAMGR